MRNSDSPSEPPKKWSVFSLHFDGEDLLMDMNVPHDKELDPRHMHFRCEFEQSESLRACMMRFIAEAMLVERIITPIDETEENEEDISPD